MPAYVVIILSFAAGALCFAAWWSYANLDSASAKRLVVKSMWLFVLPAALFVGVTEWQAFLISVFIAVAFEEGLKLLASRTERQGLAAFRLVALFGIWELMFAKPYQMIGFAFEEWTRHEVYGLILLMIVPLLMHMATALIYGFYARRWPWAQFAACYLTHLIYNEGVSFADMIGFSGAFLTAAALVLAVIVVVLWPNAGSPRFEHLLGRSRTTPK